MALVFSIFFPMIAVLSPACWHLIYKFSIHFSINSTFVSLCRFTLSFFASRSAEDLCACVASRMLMIPSLFIWIYCHYRRHRHRRFRCVCIEYTKKCAFSPRSRNRSNLRIHLCIRKATGAITIHNPAKFEFPFQSAIRPELITNGE